MSVHNICIKLNDKLEILELKGGDHWVTVTHGMSGYFAVEMWINDIDDPQRYTFPEPWDTGFGRYATMKEAYEEAQYIAEDSGMPLEYLVIP